MCSIVDPLRNKVHGTSGSRESAEKRLKFADNRNSQTNFQFQFKLIYVKSLGKLSCTWNLSSAVPLLWLFNSFHATFLLILNLHSFVVLHLRCSFVDCAILCTCLIVNCIKRRLLNWIKFPALFSDETSIVRFSSFIPA